MNLDTLIDIFTLTENDMDLFLLLVWIIPIIIFVAFGQQIQLYMTSIELKKKIRKIKTLEEQSYFELFNFINNKYNADNAHFKKINQMIDYFTIFPNDIDPNGIILKIKHIIRTRDLQTNSTLNLIFLNCDKMTVMKIQTLLEIVTTIRLFYKSVNHIFLTAKKHHNYPLILPLQLTLPFIMEEAIALKESIDPIKHNKPIGDGIGPLVINNMMKNDLCHKDIDQTIWCTSIYNKRKLYLVKAEGPYPIVGKLGDAVELLISKYKQNLIIMVDAALKLEGEKTASVFCGFGVAMGGTGIDKFQIEEISTKYKIPIFSIVVKQSIKDSLMLMTKEISEQVDHIKSIIYNTVDENVAPNQSVLLIGVGNTSGID